MLPRLIAKKMQKNNVAIADDYSGVTVLFCELCHFHAIAQRYKHEPVKIISTLNFIYARFDELVDRMGVHKVMIACVRVCVGRV
jgi:hypothetical protein